MKKKKIESNPRTPNEKQYGILNPKQKQRHIESETIYISPQSKPKLKLTTKVI